MEAPTTSIKKIGCTNKNFFTFAFIKKRNSHPMAEEIKAQKVIYTIINPLIKLLVKLGVTPNMITSFGLILNIVAAVIFIIGAKDRKSTRLNSSHVKNSFADFCL